MPDVNLLPHEDRDREKKEQELAHKQAKKVDIVFTNPAKEEKSPILPKAILPHESWWERLFGKPKVKPTPAPKPPVSGGPKIIPSPSLLPSKEPTVVAHLPPAPSGGRQRGFWGRLFGRGAVKPKNVVPLPPAHTKTLLPKESPNIAPNLLGGGMMDNPPPAGGPTPPPPIKKAPSPFIQPPKPPAPVAPPIVPPRTNVIASGTISTPKPIGATHGRVEFSDIKKEPEKKKVETGKDSVTLLPEEFRPREAQIETKLVSTVLGSIIVSAAIVAGALFVISIFQLEADNSLDIQQRNAQGIVSKINGKSAVRAEGENLQKTMEMVVLLLDRHVYWTKWFGVLEARTNVGIQWDGMEINAPLKTVTLSGVGSSITAVAQQIVALRKTPQVESVSITGVEQKKKTGSTDVASAFTFIADIRLKQGYDQEVVDHADASKKITLTRGVITFTRQEAEYDAVTSTSAPTETSLDLQRLFEGDPITTPVSRN